MHGFVIGIGWGEIAPRLALTLAAGFLIGFDRGEHGQAAGLCTTMLVCLAACIAMIQANLLLPVAGKPAGSFVTLDLMRLPLGILSGVGFLGAGAILRRSDRILGMTTAATLWIVTVIGLCFGGGQLGLGVTGTLLGILVLAGFKRIERLAHQRQEGVLTVAQRAAGDGADVAEILRRGGFRIVGEAVRFTAEADCQETQYELRWQARPDAVRPPALLELLRRDASVVSFEWAPRGSGEF